MPDLIPLKVTIRRAADGKHKFPSFNDIPGSKRDNLDWSQYIDKFGGWHYDKECGFGEADEENPDPDTWCGCFLVPEDFADAALDTFPEDVEEVDETEFERFYDNRAHAHEPELRYDTQVLQALAAKKTLGLELTDEDNAALDPDKPLPGIRRNKKRKWKDRKAKAKLKIKKRTPRRRG